MASRWVFLVRQVLLGSLLTTGLVVASRPASAQVGYGGGYGGFGGGYGGFGGGYGGYGGGYGGFGGGYGGYGGGYGGYGGGGSGLGGGYGGLGFTAVGYPNANIAGGYAGVPFPGSINAYNIGYGNTTGIGLVPPAYVGTGTAGLGPIGVGGINPLFGLGLSPLAITNATAEQVLRQRASTGSVYRGHGSPTTHYRLSINSTLPPVVTGPTPPSTVVTAPR